MLVLLLLRRCLLWLLLGCLPVRSVCNNVRLALATKHVVLLALFYIHNLHVWPHLVAPLLAVVFGLKRHRLERAASALLVAIALSVLVTCLARHILCHVKRTAHKLSKPAKTA